MTKNEAGMRNIALNDTAVAIVNKHLNTSAQSYLFKLGNNVDDTKIKIPKRYLGNPFQNKTVNKLLGRFVPAAGIKKNISSHAFRHTYISKIASYNDEFNLTFLSDIGHKDFSTTQTIYNHINSVNREALAKGYHSIDDWLKEIYN